MVLDVMPDHVRLFFRHDAESSASYEAIPLKDFTSRVPRAQLLHPHSKLPTLRVSSHFTASADAVSAATVQRYIDTPWGRTRPEAQEGNGP